MGGGGGGGGVLRGFWGGKRGSKTPGENPGSEGR